MAGITSPLIVPVSADAAVASIGTGGGAAATAGRTLVSALDIAATAGKSVV